MTNESNTVSNQAANRAANPATQPPSLLDLLHKAASDLAIYRDPDVDEVKDRLSEVLEGAALSGIRRDQLVSLSLTDKTLEIETAWTVRGCENTSSYSLPMSIIEAKDPLAAAKLWAADKALNEAKTAVAQAEARLAHAKETLAQRQAERALLIDVPLSALAM